MPCRRRNHKKSRSVETWNRLVFTEQEELHFKGMSTQRTLNYSSSSRNTRSLLAAHKFVWSVLQGASHPQRARPPIAWDDFSTFLSQSTHNGFILGGMHDDDYLPATPTQSQRSPSQRQDRSAAGAWFIKVDFIGGMRSQRSCSWVRTCSRSQRCSCKFNEHTRILS